MAAFEEAVVKNFLGEVLKVPIRDDLVGDLDDC